MLSIWEVLFASLSAIIGSGWLFAAAYTYSLAGKYAQLSWIIGAILALIIAFIFAELSTMIPVKGSSSRMPYITHGVSASAIFALVGWLSYLIYVPTETQATIQYLSIFFPSLVNPATSALTVHGYILATLMVLAYTVISIYSTKWLIKANSFITIVKIAVPLIVSLYIIFFFLNQSAPAAQVAQSTSTANWAGVFTAISMGGIFFAFNGFKMAGELAGETKNPSRAIPIAIIGSIGISLVLYLLLQGAFDFYIAQPAVAHGNAVMKVGPFASIGISNHSLRFIVPLIYVGAIIAPCAAGIVYFVSSEKAFHGLVNNGYLPKWIAYTNKNNNPVFIILLNFVISIGIFLFVHGWDSMMAVCTTLFCLSYAIGPICLLSMRKALPEFHRPFFLPISKIWCTVALWACSIAIYWCGVSAIKNTGFIIILAIALVFFMHKVRQGKHIEFKHCMWFIFYYVCVFIISYIGDQAGGLHIISGITPVVILLVISIITAILSVKNRLQEEEMAIRISMALSEKKK